MWADSRVVKSKFHVFRGLKINMLHKVPGTHKSVKNLKSIYQICFTWSWIACKVPFGDWTKAFLYCKMPSDSCKQMIASLYSVNLLSNSYLHLLVQWVQDMYWSEQTAVTASLSQTTAATSSVSLTCSLCVICEHSCCKWKDLKFGHICTCC